MRLAGQFIFPGEGIQMAAPSLTELAAVAGIVKRRWYAGCTNEELPVGWYWCGNQAHGFKVSVRVRITSQPYKLVVDSELKIKNAIVALEAGCPGEWNMQAPSSWYQLMPADYVFDVNAYLKMIDDEVKVTESARRDISFIQRHEKRKFTLDERIAYEEAAVRKHYAEITKAQLAAAWDELDDDAV